MYRVRFVFAGVFWLVTQISCQLLGGGGLRDRLDNCREGNVTSCMMGAPGAQSVLLKCIMNVIGALIVVYSLVKQR